MGTSSENTGTSREIIVQGTILAAAQFIVRVIGLFYRIPLQRICGDVAMGYYGYAYDIYTVLLLLSSNGVPVAVSKLVSTYHAKRDFKNEYKMMKSALWWTLIVGTAIGGLTFVFARQITRFLFGPEMMGVVPALRVLAPTLFICCVMSTFRGYFQGINTMMPTAVSQIFEQLFNAVVSVAAAVILAPQGAAMAAMGGTLGTFAGALVSMIFLIFIFVLYRPQLMRRVERDTYHKELPYGETYRLLTLTMGPVIVSSVIYQVSGIIDSSIYSNISTQLGYDPELISTLYGIYSSKYKLLINVPLAMATALQAAVVPGVAAAYIRGDKQEVYSKIGTAVKFCMVIAIPACVGLSLLSSPILQLLFGDATKLSSHLLMIGTPFLFFFSLATVSIGALQGIDKMNTPIIISCIALAVHVVFIVILLRFCNMNVYAILYSNILFGFIATVLNNMALKKYVGYEQEIVHTFLLPGLASAVMGLVVYLLYHGLMRIFPHNSINTIISVLAAIVVYSVALIKTRALSEDEIYQMPKGAKIVRLAKRFHLL